MIASREASGSGSAAGRRMAQASGGLMEAPMTDMTNREAQGYVLDVRRDLIEQAPYMTLDHAGRPHCAEEPVYRYWDQYI